MTRHDELVNDYLSSKGATLSTATEAQGSDAQAFAFCYQWYIDVMQVTQENAFLASNVWVSKYALHDKQGICLESTPEDMWDRLATVLTEEELKTNPKLMEKDRDKTFKMFRDGLKGFSYTPQGSGLFALGNPYVKASSSNCFTLPPPTDNLESIFDTAKNMAKIYAARGGEGHDISGLRPSGASTNNAARTSTGAVSFMDFYSYVTGMIGQEGRRGANLLMMRVSHPDIFKFIAEKSDTSKQSFFDELAEKGLDINDYRWSAVADRLKSTSHSNVSVMMISWKRSRMMLTTSYGLSLMIISILGSLKL